MPIASLRPPVQPTAPAPRRVAVLVLGMHRAGTSVLTRLIGELGADLPFDPDPPGNDNPAGYWEPGGLVRLHERLLWDLGSSWLDLHAPDLSRLRGAQAEDYLAGIRACLVSSFGQSRCFVLKDPRICRMVPLYRRLLEDMEVEVRVVLALRAPAAVAASLRRRNLISAQYAGMLWASHMLSAERHTRTLPRITVSYEDVMADWRAPARRLAAFLADGVPAVDVETLRSPVRAELHHHHAEGDGPFCGPLARLLDQILAAFSAGAPPDRLDRLRARFRTLRDRGAGLATVEHELVRLLPPHGHAPPRDPILIRREIMLALDRLQQAALSPEKADKARSGD